MILKINVKAIAPEVIMLFGIWACFSKNKWIILTIISSRGGLAHLWHRHKLLMGLTFQSLPQKKANDKQSSLGGHGQSECASPEAWACPYLPLTPVCPASRNERLTAGTSSIWMSPHCSWKLPALQTIGLCHVPESHSGYLEVNFILSCHYFHDYFAVV